MSKRIIKNIAMIVLIVALCISMYFTIKPQIMRYDFEKRGTNFDEKRMMEKPERTENRVFSEKMDNSRGVERKANSEGMPAMPGDGSIPEMPEGANKEKMSNEFSRRSGELTGFRILLVGFEAFGISLILLYLILSKFNKLNVKETFVDKSKITTFIILVILITAIITMIVLLVNKNERRSFRGERGTFMPMEEEVEKETKAEDVDSGENVNTEIINLNEHTSNITITEAGNYTLKGEFGYTVLIDADGEVVLNLDNAKIKNELTAALANISKNPLTINLLDGTNNVFSDGGSSEYDACVFSNGPLTFKGTGSLDVYGNQEDGEGIATETNNLTIDGGNINIVSNDDGLNAGGDGGTIKINAGNLKIKASGDGIDSNKNIVINGGSIYTIGSSKGGDAGVDADDGTTINGGELIALGSDMLEKPLNDSKQKVIVTNLDKIIETETELTLKDKEGNEIMSFKAEDNFKTIIISSSKLKEGKYNLFNGTELITELECK